MHVESSAQVGSRSLLEPAITIALITTAAQGVVTATAPLIPTDVRAVVLVLVLLAWVCSTLAAGGWVLGRLGATVLRGEDRALPALVGLLGIGVSVLAMSQLALVRSLLSRPALTWSVDWRFSWNHAEAIARTGGAQHALDYSGQPLDYHVGPAWSAGAVDQLLGSGAPEVLFGVIPAVCVLAIALACLRVLRHAGINDAHAAPAVGLAFSVPGLLLAYAPLAPTTVLQVMLNPASAHLWLFSPAFILNGLLGLTVGMAIVALIFQETYDRRSLLATLVAAAALGGLVSIKPQYFAAFGLMVGLIGLMRLRRVWRSRPFPPPIILVVAVAAFGVAVLLMFAMGSGEGLLGVPRWAPGRTNFSPMHAVRELVSLHMLIAIAAGATLLRGERFAALREVSLAAVLAMVLIGAVLMSVQFSLPADVLDRADTLGMPDVRTDVGANLVQALIPLRVVIILCTAAIMVSALGTSERRRVWLLLALLIGALRSPLLILGFARPADAYEAAEDPGLHAVLATVPVEGIRLISSDIADPAEDYGRSQRGFLLSAYHGHEIYLANVRYYRYAEADVVERITHLRVFFGSSWSGWHDGWLRRESITHILVHDRCPPAWRASVNSTGAPLMVVARAGEWTVYSTRDPANSMPTELPRWRDIRPEYGSGACITSAAPFVTESP